MKNNLLKYYITAAYLCSTFVMFAEDPGAGGVGGDEPVLAPIDDYVWFLIGIGIVFAFYKCKQIANQNKVNNVS
jgi:hypothetical protein